MSQQWGNPPGPPAGWYADPQVPGTQRFWDGAAWTAHTAPPAAPPPPPGPGFAAPGPFQAGQQGQPHGSYQGYRSYQGQPYPQSQPYGAYRAQPPAAPGAWVAPPRPGETLDQSTIRRLATYERVSGWCWLALGILQVLSVILILAGAWNIYASITRIQMASRIERREPRVPVAFESVTGYVVIGVINLFFGAFLGVLLVGADLFVRDQVLKNRHLFGVAVQPGVFPGPQPGSLGYPQPASGPGVIETAETFRAQAH